MEPTDATATTERRQAPVAIRHGGRRWRDDSDLADAVDRVLLQTSRDFHLMRDCREWSQEDVAKAAGIAPNTILAIEQARHDPHISTLVRLAHVYGFELIVSLRRPKRAPHAVAVNPAVAATSP